MDTEYWPAGSNPGSGVFCTKKGSWKITLKPGLLTVWTDKEPAPGSKEEDYAMGPAKEGPWLLPSEQSFKSGVFHHGFKVQHSKDPKKQTHELLLIGEKDNMHYVISPLKHVVTEPGQEFAYDYGYNKIKQ